MNTGIAVIAHDRPDYLYICLDALHRAKGIEEYDIWIFFDGGLTPEIRQAQNDVLGEFPMVRPYFHETAQPTGILQSITRALYMMSQQYERTFYIEDDHLVRPDILEVLNKTDQKGFFLCMTGGSEYLSNDYRARGNVITTVNFSRLYSWLERKRYYGLKDRAGRIMTEETTSHDAVYGAFLIHEKEQTQFVKGYYVAHFGLFGKNSRKENATTEALALHHKIFTGAKEIWMQNVIDILGEGDYSDDLRLSLWPKGFNYRGAI